MSGQELYAKLYDLWTDGKIGSPTIQWSELSPMEQEVWEKVVRDND